jgi:hypothetical protein
MTVVTEPQPGGRPQSLWRTCGGVGKQRYDGGYLKAIVGNDDIDVWRTCEVAVTLLLHT